MQSVRSSHDHHYLPQTPFRISFLLGQVFIRNRKIWTLKYVYAVVKIITVTAADYIQRSMANLSVILFRFPSPFDL